MSRKPSPIAYVEWFDSGTIAAGWEPLEATLEEAKAQRDNRIRSAGLLLARNREYVVLAVMHNGHADDVGGAVMIPTKNVTRIETWDPDRERA